jgi:hypothetical protein
MKKKITLRNRIKLITTVAQKINGNPDYGAKVYLVF